jgi:hypothetical protein
MINDKQTILTAGEQSIQAVEQTLTEFHDLEIKVTELEKGIEKLAQSEADILAGEGSEERKTQNILKLRATVDVRKSNVGKLVLEREALKDEIFFLTVRANNLLGAVEQTLIAHRTEAVCEKLSEIFEPEVVKQMRNYASYSKPVKELSRDQFVLIQSRSDLYLDAASKMRGVWNALLAAVNNESVGPMFGPVPDSWLSEPAVRPVSAPMNRDVAFAGGKS